MLPLKEKFNILITKIYKLHIFKYCSQINIHSLSINVILNDNYFLVHVLLFLFIIVAYVGKINTSQRIYSAFLKKKKRIPIK